MVRFTLILALFNNWIYAVEVGDQVIGISNEGELEIGQIADVLELRKNVIITSIAPISYGTENVNWEIYDDGTQNPQEGSQIVPRYYLIDGDDYFGGTADYIFKIDYKVTWDAKEYGSTYKVQPQGVTVIDYQTQLDPIEYSVWLVKYKGNEVVNRYNGNIFYFSTVSYSTPTGISTRFRVPPPEVTYETPSYVSNVNLSFSMEVTVVGNYAVVGTTPNYSPLYTTPVQGFVDHHLKFNVQESIFISL